MRRRRDEPAPPPAPGAGRTAPGPADGRRTEHDGRRRAPRPADRRRPAVGGTGRAGGAHGGHARRGRGHLARTAGPPRGLARRCRRRGRAGRRRRARRPPAGAGDPVTAGGGRRAAGVVRRPHRRRRAAPGRRPAAAGGAAVPDVPGRVRLGRGADGLDRGRHGLGRRARDGRPARRVAAQPDRRRPGRRRRRRAGVPAADRHPVRLHPGAGGLRLPAARGLPARPPDGRAGVVGALVHPAAGQLRLRDPRHHGHWRR